MNCTATVLLRFPSVLPKALKEPPEPTRHSGAIESLNSHADYFGVRATHFTRRGAARRVEVIPNTEAKSLQFTGVHIFSELKVSGSFDHIPHSPLIVRPARLHPSLNFSMSSLRYAIF